MKKTTRMILSVLGMAVTLLTGCAHQGTNSSGDTSFGYQSSSEMGNYKCTAVDASASGRTFEGWASSQRNARENAMDKCQAHARQSGACQITHCVSDM